MRADEVLKNRARRSCAKLLTLKEREIDPLLLEAPGGRRASELLRKAILDHINDFCEMAIDVANSGEAQKTEFGADVWVRKIDESLARIEAIIVEEFAARANLPEDGGPSQDPYPEPQVRDHDGQAEPVPR